MSNSHREVIWAENGAEAHQVPPPPAVHQMVPAAPQVLMPPPGVAGPTSHHHQVLMHHPQLVYTTAAATHHQPLYHESQYLALDPNLFGTSAHHLFAGAAGGPQYLAVAPMPPHPQAGAAVHQPAHPFSGTTTSHSSKGTAENSSRVPVPPPAPVMVHPQPTTSPVVIVDPNHGPWMDPMASWYHGEQWTQRGTASTGYTPPGSKAPAAGPPHHAWGGAPAGGYDSYYGYSYGGYGSSSYHGPPGSTSRNGSKEKSDHYRGMMKHGSFYDQSGAPAAASSHHDLSKATTNNGNGVRPVVRNTWRFKYRGTRESRDATTAGPGAATPAAGVAAASSSKSSEDQKLQQYANSQQKQTRRQMKQTRPNQGAVAAQNKTAQPGNGSKPGSKRASKDSKELQETGTNNKGSKSSVESQPSSSSADEAASEKPASASAEEASSGEGPPSNKTKPASTAFLEAATTTAEEDEDAAPVLSPKSRRAKRMASFVRKPLKDVAAYKKFSSLFGGSVMSSKQSVIPEETAADILSPPARAAEVAAGAVPATTSSVSAEEEEKKEQVEDAGEGPEGEAAEAGVAAAGHEDVEASKVEEEASCAEQATSSAEKAKTPTLEAFIEKVEKEGEVVEEVVTVQ
ncbi:unnamed protein product [Amoebophrya sp. A120]|nr:unnamed protein product [Amoebophrya sp. A120]|eukprot:GSA120T00001495001.1